MTAFVYSDAPSVVSATPAMVRERLDASYYAAKYLWLDRVSETAACHTFQPLGELLQNVRRVMYMSTKSYARCDAPPSAVPFISGVDLDESSTEVKWDQIRYVAPEMAQKHPQGLLRDNSLLIKVKGPHQLVAYVGKSHRAALVSGTIVVGEPHGVDAHYLTMALRSRYAQEWRTRLRKNITVEFTPYEDLKDIPIPVPEPEVQQAIGDSVRKAEALWAVARQAKTDADKMLQQEMVLQEATLEGVAQWWVSQELSTRRLDPQFYSAPKIRALRHLANTGIHFDRLGTLSEITAMVGWKGLTTEHYTDEGPLLVRGVDFEDGQFNVQGMVRVDVHKYAEQPQIHLRKGDVVFTKDGSVGKAIVVPDFGQPACAGSTVARLRPDVSVDPFYLEAVLGSSVALVQTASFVTGLAQPHLTQEWIAEILVPRLACEQSVAKSIRKHHNAIVEARQLLEQAQLDIDAIMLGAPTSIDSNNMEGTK